MPLKVREVIRLLEKNGWVNAIQGKPSAIQTSQPSPVDHRAG
jgi:predicted RNA binding protein YcfA (HicA-like mRNA interferase family)